jgi:PAS domain S-box-containing protein
MRNHDHAADQGLAVPVTRPQHDGLRRAMSMRSTVVVALLTLALAAGVFVAGWQIVKHVDKRQIAALSSTLPQGERPDQATLDTIAGVLTEGSVWIGSTEVAFEGASIATGPYGRPAGPIAIRYTLPLGDSGLTVRIGHSAWEWLLFNVATILLVAWIYQTAIWFTVRPQLAEIEARRENAVEAQRALEVSEERYRGIASITADMFWETDPEGNVTFIMTAGDGRLEPVARVAKDIKGQPVSALLDQFAPGAAAQLERRFARRRAFSGFQIDGTTPEGPLYLVSSGRPLFDDTGTFLGFQGATRDVTELVIAQREADTATRQIESLFSNAPAAILITDMDRRLVQVNRTYCEWTGTTPGQLIGKYHAGTANAHVSAWADTLETRVVQTGEMVEAERTITWQDGKTRRVSVIKYPIRDGGGALSLVGTIITDITRLHEAEERLNRAQRLEAIGQLTGGVAHDFNNLLTVARGNLELLQFRLGEAEPTVKKHIDATLRAIDHGASLTQQLLSYARKQALSPTAIDVRETLERFGDMVRRLLRENITVTVAVKGELSDIQADPSQLEAALLNLALNAQDAMPQGGTLTIAAAPSGAQHVAISVTDTGTGIDESIREKVLEPFFTTKDVGEGSGLGLSMVYGFVKQSGGDFELKSTVGRGTTVSLAMPVVGTAIEPDDAPVEEIEILPSEGIKSSALLVEDNPDLREVAEMMLRSLGYRVDSAADAETALRHLEAHQDYDVLLTDLVLPGAMSGRQLAERAHRSHPDMRIVITSGYADSVLKAEGALPEDFAFLPKPYRLASVSQAVGAGIGKPH